MTLLVDLEQAVADALTAWLVSQFGDAQVNSHWPDADTVLKPKVITILRTSDPEYAYCEPVVIKSTPPSGGNLGTYVWRYATCSLSFQVEIWANSRPARADLIARMLTAMSASKTLTLAAFLAAGGNTTQQDPFEQAIYLQLAAPWDHILAEYEYKGASANDSPDSVQRREYRATGSIEVFYDATETRTSPQLNSVIVAQYPTTNPSLTMPSPTTTNELTTITATTITHSRGPRPT